MFEKFNDAARQCLVQASQEVRRRQDAGIGTIALLVGIASVDGVGRNALAACGATAERLSALRDGDGAREWADAEGADVDDAANRARRTAAKSKAGGRGLMAWRRRRQVVSERGHLPFTAGVKKALELGLREAVRLDQDAVGPGHLLLGLLRAEDEPVDRLLTAAGVAPAALRAQTQRRLGSADTPVAPDGVEAGVDHLALQVEDVPASKAFYDAVLEPLGMRALMEFSGRVGYGPEPPGVGRPQFWLGPAAGAGMVREVHVAFNAPDRASVQAFHDAAVQQGAVVLHEPREFPEYHPGYWASFVRDPDGNNVEAVCHQPGGSQ